MNLGAYYLVDMIKDMLLRSLAWVPNGLTMPSMATSLLHKVKMKE